MFHLDLTQDYCRIIKNAIVELSNHQTGDYYPYNLISNLREVMQKLNAGNSAFFVDSENGKAKDWTEYQVFLLDDGVVEVRKREVLNGLSDFAKLVISPETMMTSEESNLFSRLAYRALLSTFERRFELSDADLVTLHKMCKRMYKEHLCFYGYDFGANHDSVFAKDIYNDNKIVFQVQVRV